MRTNKSKRTTSAGASAAQNDHSWTTIIGVDELTQMASKNDAANIKHLIATIRKNKDAALGSGVKDALVAMNHRRALFIMCSGMHTPDVQNLVKRLCGGELRGPGLYVLSLLVTLLAHL